MARKPAQDKVRHLRREGRTEAEIRARLKDEGYKPGRITQLLTLTRAEEGPRQFLHVSQAQSFADLCFVHSSFLSLFSVSPHVAMPCLQDPATSLHALGSGSLVTEEARLVVRLLCKMVLLPGTYIAI